MPLGSGLWSSSEENGSALQQFLVLLPFGPVYTTSTSTTTTTTTVATNWPNIDVEQFLSKERNAFIISMTKR